MCDVKFLIIMFTTSLITDKTGIKRNECNYYVDIRNKINSNTHVLISKSRVPWD